MKRLLCLVLAFVMMASISVAAFADIYAEENGLEEQVARLQVDELTRQEETVWYFRIYMGRHQMRLWSITYGKWLTDWIDIGPA